MANQIKRVMKELSIEEKARRYDEAVERAKLELNSPYKRLIEYIFPGLKESEDERIRKDIISLVYEFWAKIGSIHPEFTTHDKMIAWLEKQGEQKPTDKVEPKFKIGDTVTVKPMSCHGKVFKGEPFKIVDIIEDNYVSDDGKTYSISLQDGWKLVEQNPAWSEANLPEFESYLCLMFQKFRTKGMCTNGEIIDYVKEHAQKLKDALCHAWSDEDDSNTSELCSLITESYNKETASELRQWLKSLKGRVQPQPNQEWSEEDKDKLNHIIATIKLVGCRVNNNATNQSYINWLESLKNRVVSQPKQEWSEEDEKMHTATIFALAGFMGNEDKIDWLSHLKGRYTWKPSDEQIKAVRLARSFVTDDFDDNPTLSEILIELEEQLKKLRNE